MGDRKTWRDIFKERIPDYEEKRLEAHRAKRLENEGCVIRSLESIIGVSLTREQEDFRLKQIESSHDVLELLYEKKRGGGNPNIREAIDDAMKFNTSEVLEFIQMVGSQVDTYSGTQHRNFRYEYKRLNASQIIEECNGGSKVMILNPYHAAHIAPTDRENMFTSISDGGEALRIPDIRADYDTIIFDRIKND